MDLRLMGKTGVKVSCLCLGAMDFGHAAWGADEEESLAIIDAYIDRGGNFIDTANVYSAGVSEKIVGEGIRKVRDRVILATKGFFPMVQTLGDPPAHPNAIGATRRHLTSALEGSLKRLGTDYVDLYQMHCWDPFTPIEETLSTLDGLIRQGKVRYAGLSNYTAWQIAEARQLCRIHGWEPFVTAQMQYSLICRDIEPSVLPVCERYDIGVLPWSPLGQGVLTGKYSADGKGPSEARFGQEPRNEAAARWRARYLNERTLAIAEVVKEVARDLETTPVALSIAWLLRRPKVTSVIIGPRSVDQLEGNLAAGDLEIPDDAMARLEEASAQETPYPEAFQEMSPRLVH